MADKNLELKVRISAQLTELQNALRSVQGQLDQLGRKGKQAGQQASQGVSRLEGSVRGAITAVKGLVGAYATLATVRSLVNLADQAKLLDARLKLATRSTEEYGRAQALLFDIAQRTGSSLAETINLYARFAQSTGELGISQDQLLQVTESVNQAVQLSGASADSANAALIQLGQGIASGTLRGEELNSVLEQTPRLARALADGLGVSVGELRKLGQEGQLTAEQVLAALQSQKEVLAGEFAQLPVTVARAFTNLGNSTLRAVGQIDQAVGASSSLADAIQSVSAYLDTGELQAAFAGTMAVWQSAISQTIGDIANLDRILGDLFQTIGLDGSDAAGAIVDAFRNLPANVRAFLQIMVVEAAAALDKVINAARSFKEIVTAVFTDDTVDDAIRRNKQEYQNIETARRDSIEAILEERQASIDKGKAASDAIKAEIEARKEQQRRQGPAAPAAATRKEAPGGSVDEFELLKDGIQRQLALIERGYQQSEISAVAYYARRRELQTQAIDAEIAQQQVALGKLKDDDDKGRSKILTQIAVLQRQKADIERQAANDAADAARDLQEKMEDLRVRLLRGDGQAVEARKLELEAEFRDLIRRLQAEGDTAGVELINGLINTEVSKEAFAQVERQFNALAERLRATQESLANRVKLGEITPAQGTQLLAQERADTVAQMTTLNEQAQGLAATIKDPTIAASADNLTNSLNRIAEEGATGVALAQQQLRADLQQMEQTFAASAASAGVDALSNLFTDLVSGSKSAGDAIKDFVRGFAQQMAQLAARALATYIILQTLDAIYPGLGQATAASISVGAGTRHTGGVAGQGPVRQVPGFVFAGAPRYHGGGVAGLAPGEVPAILKRGEEVLTQDDPRHVNNGGGDQAGGSGTRIINVIDPNLVQDYLTSSSGEKTLVNLIQRNAGAIKQVLA